MLRRVRVAVLLWPTLLAFVLPLTACMGPPRPFAGDGEPPPPVSGTGVAVPPVQGAPPVVARALAEAVARGLSAAEIPARVAEGAPDEHRVIGSVLEVVPLDSDSANGGAVPRVGLVVGLELRDALGRPVVVRQVRGTLPESLWRGAVADDAESAPAFAAELAAAAEAMVTPALPALTAAEQALVPVPSAEPEGLADGTLAPAPDALPAVEVLPMTGAPGGGSNDLLLARAARAALREVGVPLARDAADAEAAVAALVSLAPVVDGRERITVTWTVMTPQGGEIGTVSQQNVLPAGYAKAQWADLAFLIAAAAVDGLVPLLRRAGAEAPAAR